MWNFLLWLEKITKQKLKAKSNWKSWQIQFSLCVENFMSMRRKGYKGKLELWKLKVNLFLCLLKLKSWNIKLTGTEQFSRGNSILIHSVPEEKREDTDSLVMETVKEEMVLDTLSADIDRTHRIGSPPKQSAKVRPVIDKFVRYDDRRKNFINKKSLKGTKVSIIESLTADRVAKL